LTSLSRRPSMPFRWLIKGKRSCCDATTCDTEESATKRTAFFFPVSIVEWKMRAFWTVCGKSRSRWCSRRYCDNSVDATPSSNLRFNAASRWSVVAVGHASLCRIRSACSNSTIDSESIWRRASNFLIASRELSTSPKRCSSRDQSSARADGEASSKSRSTSAADPSSASVRC